MRTGEQEEGWMFINFVAITLYYRLYNKLLKANLLKQYSVEDILAYLKEIEAYHAGRDFRVEEIPRKYQTLLRKIGICIT